MVIHTSSGVASLVLAFWLGGKAQPIIPHNVPFVLLGAALLWFGWFGFNAGSAVSAGYQGRWCLEDSVCAYRSANCCTLAAAAGLALTNTQLGARPQCSRGVSL